MSCLSAAFNVAGAALTVIGSAMLSAGAILAPDPTFLTKLAAAAAVAATVGAVAWLIAALIEFVNCGKKAGMPREEVEELERELRDLQEKLDALQRQ